MIRRTLPRLRSHLLYETSKLKFSCTECGKCCKGRTNVFVNEIEVSQLAEHLEMYKILLIIINYLYNFMNINIILYYILGINLILFQNTQKIEIHLMEY